jgi:3-phytase
MISLYLDDWIIATSKGSNALFLYDAHNGNLIREVVDLDMYRPNGVTIFPDLDILCVVERDGHKAQLFELPSFKRLEVFGQDILKRPYGSAIQKLSSPDGSTDKHYRLFITDNYMEQQWDETKKKMSYKKLPPISELNGRVKVFNVIITAENQVTVKYERSFGETDEKTNGVLKVVESIVVDSHYNRLLIADEHESSMDVKIYDLDTLEFSGNKLGSRHDKAAVFEFNAEPEGIALYSCSKKNGYYIFTEQLLTLTQFHVLNRRDFSYLGTFTGHVTKKTDGVAVSRESFADFERGMFIAIHDDSKVSAWKWADISKALGLQKDEYCNA